MKIHNVSCISLTLLLLPAFSFGDDGGSKYVQHNLVADLPGADHTETSLKNAWGIERGPTSPWWVNANGTGLSFLFDAAGNEIPLVVTVPPATGSTPTGIVFNGGGDFEVAMGQPARFIFATEDGTISGWNPADGTLAVLKVTTPNAVYKGITLGSMNGANFIYAANFRTGAVDVFDAKYQPVTLANGAFHDHRVPAGYAPFNVQNINGNIVVTFAQQDAAMHDDVPGPGNGFVDIFKPDGTLMRRLDHVRALNSPWGIAWTPRNFGELSNKLLIGNFGSGQIAAFDAGSGEFEGLMRGAKGKPIVIDGLWGLKFGNGSVAGPTNVLFFAAGPNGESDGLFGTLMPAAKKDNDNDGDDN